MQVSAKHDLSDYVKLLDVFGKLVLVRACAAEGCDGDTACGGAVVASPARCFFSAQVGISPDPLPLDHMPLVFGNRTVSGSVIGGIQETADMLKFCGEHNIASDVEVISIKTVNEALERMLKSDVKYRFVIDIARTLGDEGAQ